MVLRSQLGELLFRLALQDAVHVGLQDCLDVLGMDIHEKIDRRSLGHAQQIHLHLRQVGELRQHSLQGGEHIREFAVFRGDLDRPDAEAFLGPEELGHAVLVSGHAAGDGRIARENPDGVVVQVGRLGPDADQRRRAVAEGQPNRMRVFKSTRNQATDDKTRE